jgi:hypothetical protein
LWHRNTSAPARKKNERTGIIAPLMTAKLFLKTAQSTASLAGRNHGRFLPWCHTIFIIFF